MQEYAIKLAVALAVVFVFCRVFVVDNIGLWLSGLALLALGVFAAVLAETQPVPPPPESCSGTRIGSSSSSSRARRTHQRQHSFSDKFD
jgi:hypothetical protein